MAPAKKAPTKSVDLSTSTDAADLSLSRKPTELSTLITKLTEAFTLSFNSCVDQIDHCNGPEDQLQARRA